MFVSKHNLAFLTSDHATKLFPKMFPDSEIAKQFACGRTKTTAILKEALSHYLKVTKESMSNQFSIMMDESNDKIDKSCIILVRVLDPAVGDVRTRFLDMPVVNIGTAKNLFCIKILPQCQRIGFLLCGGIVMKGARSGLQKLIQNDNSNLYDVGCICHLADLTVKAGLQTLPVDIDQLFIVVFYYFYHSSKRSQQFSDLWCSLFTTEPDTIHKHCPTRWLSLLRCVDRYLVQLDGLKSFFLSTDEQTEEVQSIIFRLHNPLLKPILLFLSHILPAMDRFNRMFQKSNENTTCQLYNEMCRLTRLYAANVLKCSIITKPPW